MGSHDLGGGMLESKQGDKAGDESSHGSAMKGLTRLRHSASASMDGFQSEDIAGTGGGHGDGEHGEEDGGDNGSPSAGHR